MNTKKAESTRTCEYEMQHLNSLKLCMIFNKQLH